VSLLKCRPPLLANCLRITGSLFASSRLCSCPASHTSLGKCSSLVLVLLNPTLIVCSTCFVRFVCRALCYFCRLLTFFSSLVIRFDHSDHIPPAALQPAHLTRFSDLLLLQPNHRSFPLPTRFFAILSLHSFDLFSAFRF
jgi:hypothetical protein